MANSRVSRSVCWAVVIVVACSILALFLDQIPLQPRLPEASGDKNSQPPSVYSGSPIYPLADNPNGMGKSSTAIPSSKVFKDTGNGYSFEYPSDLVTYTPVQNEFDELEHYVTDGGSWVYFTFPDSYTLASTTGISSSMAFGTSLQGTSSCEFNILSKLFPNDKVLATPGKAVVGGLTFDTVHIGGCGAGECSDVSQYSLVRNGRCFIGALSEDDGAPRDPATPYPAQEAQTSRQESVLKNTFLAILTSLTFTN